MYTKTQINRKNRLKRANITTQSPEINYAMETKLAACQVRRFNAFDLKIYQLYNAGRGRSRLN